MLGALGPPPPTGLLRVDSGCKPRASPPDSNRQSPPGQCPDSTEAYQHCRLWPTSMVHVGRAEHDVVAPSRPAEQRRGRRTVSGAPSLHL